MQGKTKGNIWKTWPQRQKQQHEQITSTLGKVLNPDIYDAK